MYTRKLITLLLILTMACASNPDQFSASCPQVVKNSRKLIAIYDVNRDGRIDWREWQPWAAQLAEMTRQTNQRYNSEGMVDGAAMFRMRDLNGDGFIDLSEIARVPAGPGQTKTCV